MGGLRQIAESLCSYSISISYQTSDPFIGRQIVRRPLGKTKFDCTEFYGERSATVFQNRITVRDAEPKIGS